MGRVRPLLPRGGVALPLPSQRSPQDQVSNGRTGTTSGTFADVDLGYARSSTAKQDLDQQVDALHRAELSRCLRSGRTPRRSQGLLEGQGK